MVAVSRARTCHYGCMPGARGGEACLRPIPGSQKRMNWNAQLLRRWNAALKIVTLGGDDSRSTSGLLFFEKL